jgi:hypothetical protein
VLCLNDFFDGNDFSSREYRATRRSLCRSPGRATLNEFVRRLRDLERRRPSPHGDARNHSEVQAYRESVVRLSLGTIAATTLRDLTIEDGIRATSCDEDLETLYRIVMLCQIIDDVFDFAADTADDLPSFLTAHTSPSQSLTLTSDAAMRYARRSDTPCAPHLFPFRVALLGISAVAKAAMIYGHARWRCQSLRNRTTLMADGLAPSDAHL